MKTLRISDELALPLDAVTQTFGILAVRGAGKSNTAAAMAEEMFKAGLPFVVVDPVGSWFGMRSSANGKEPGLPIPIFGGRHGDIPLEKTGGKVLADAVVDQRLTCVLDISELSEGDKTRFLIDFAEQLYRRNTEPLHLFLEEADDYAPQRPFREQARLLRAWENVVRRGRARGLGITMITQRSAALNKSVLTQIETLIAMRTTSPQDRKAIAAWIEYHGQAKELLDSLPGLAAGEAWVWSPSWLKVLERVRIRRRETFDSGATPKNVKGHRPTTTLADVDLGALKDKMAATIERAKAEDPKALKLKISQLEREVRELKLNPVVGPVEVPIVLPDLMAKLDNAAHAFMSGSTHLLGITQEIVEPLKQIADRIAKIESSRLAIGTQRFASGRAREEAPRKGRVASATAGGSPASSGNGKDHGQRLPVGERKILTAVAQHQDGVTREQLTVLTGYKRSSRDTYLQRLREKKLIEFADNGILPTDSGIAALGPGFSPLPLGDDLRVHWLERLPEGERRILQVLVDAYPKDVDRDALSEATEYRRSSRDTYLQRLSARKLVVPVGRGAVRASEELFG